MSRRNQKDKPKPKIEFGKDSLNLGGIEFTNLKLQDIIAQAGLGIDGADTNSPEFQKMLDDFATQQSKAIVDSAVKTMPPQIPEGYESISPPSADDSQASVSEEEEKDSVFVEPRKDLDILFRPYANSKYWETFNNILEERQRDAVRKEHIREHHKQSLKKPKHSPAAPPPPKTNFFKKQKTNMFFGGKYVNPNGTDSNYFASPGPIEFKTFQNHHQYSEDDIENDCVRDRMYPPLDETELVYKTTVELAQRILDIDFRFSFAFTMDIIIGSIGIVRRLTWFMTGHDTYTDLDAQLRDQFAEGENFQLFYLNFDGQYMEIHDNKTLKQALITHGAYPRGAHCPHHNVFAKFWMIPSTRATEELIFEREKDMIMAGDAALMQRQDDEALENIPFFLTPELKFEPVYQHVIKYSEEEISRRYNQFTDALELIHECQYPREVDELLSEPRHKRLDQYQIHTCLEARFNNPYKGMSACDSVQRDYLVIMDGFRKSCHQTKEALQEIENIMKADIADWKQKEAERRVRQMPIQVMHLPSGFSGPHTVQHIPNPALLKAEAPMTLSQIMQTSDYKPAYVNMASGSRDVGDDVPSIINKLKHDSESLQSNVKNLIEERDGYIGKDDIEIEEVPGTSTTIRIGESYRPPREEVYTKPVVDGITGLLSQPKGLKGLLSPPNKHAEQDKLIQQSLQDKDDARVKKHMNQVIHQMNTEDVRVPTRDSEFTSHRDTVVTTSADNSSLEDEDTPPTPPAVSPPPLEEVDEDDKLLPEELEELGMMGHGVGIMSPFARLAACQEAQTNVIPLAANAGFTQMDAILASLQIDQPDAVALSAVVEKKRLDGQTVAQPNIAKFISKDTVNLAPTAAFVPPVQYTFIPPSSMDDMGKEPGPSSGKKKKD